MFKLHTTSDEIINVEQGHYPDGTLMLHLPDKAVRTIEWHYEDDADLFTLICLKRHYDKFNEPITLAMPYIPHARMDRVKEPEDVFTLKYFCEVINSLNFRKVLVADAHSNVSLALLDRVQQAPIEEFIQTVLECVFTFYTSAKDLTLFFPDEGAMKRYSTCVDLPYAFGVKKRDWKTGKIQDLQIINSEAVKGKDILIIDDICSRGGTFLHAAKALKKAGAKDVYLYVTHAEDTMVEGEMYNDPNLIKHIFTAGFTFNKELDIFNKVTII